MVKKKKKDRNLNFLKNIIVNNNLLQWYMKNTPISLDFLTLTNY